MMHWLKWRSVKILIVVLLVDLSFFSLVNPTASSSFVLIAGSLLIGLTLYLVFRLLTQALAPLIGLSLAAQKRLSIFAAAFLMFLMLMQSVGQLSRRDVIAGVILLALFYLYSSYISKAQSDLKTNHTRADGN